MTNQEDEYIKQIMGVTTLSVASKKQYSDKLQMTMRLTKKSLDWIVQNPKQTYNTLRATYTEIQTIGCYLTAILSLFKHVPSVNKLKDSKPELYTTYRGYHEEIYAEINELYRSGEATERQKKGYVDWPTLIDKRETLSESSYASKEHLLLSMYTYIKPVRQDFNHLKILDEMPENPLEGNYIVLPVPEFKYDEAMLILNDHKASKYKGFKHCKAILCKELVDIIRKSLEKYPRMYLFVDCNGQPYQLENSYIKHINKLLGKLFGKPLTVTLLRHSWVAYERTLNLTPGEEEDNSKQMMHSLKEHNRYRLRL